MPDPLRRLIYALIGLALLPMLTGLGASCFALLVAVQRDGSSSQLLLKFGVGVMIGTLGFIFLPRPVRTYILAHELTHLLAAWLSGVPAGGLQVHRQGGSVTVARPTAWIALAPYILPFYTLLLLGAHLLASLWWDPARWSPALPVLLGLSWSFHVCFTLFALTRPQSDLVPYGYIGALPIILVGNCLLVCLALMVIHPEGPGMALEGMLTTLKRHYEGVYRQLFNFFSALLQ